MSIYESAYPDDREEKMGHNQDRLLSVKEAMYILGLGRATVYEMCRTRQIKQVRFGSRVLIPESALKELVDKHTLPVRK